MYEIDIPLRYAVIKEYCAWANLGSPTIIPRFAVISAISAMASVISATRCSPIGDGGLVQYFCFLAGSGIGKRRYLDCARQVSHMIHPALVADCKPRSDVGLYRLLGESPALTFYFEEFSQYFENMMQGKNSSQTAIAEAFLYSYDCPDYLDGGANKRKIDSTSAVNKPVMNLLSSMTTESYQKIAKLKSMRHDGLSGRIEAVIESSLIETNNDIIKIDPPEKILNIFAYNARMTLEDINKFKRTPTETDQREYGNITYRKRDPFKITDEAKHKFNKYRAEFCYQAQIKHGIEAQILARMAERIMRTACCLCAFENRNDVNEEDLEYAFMLHVENFQNILPLVSLSSIESVEGEVEERIIRALKKLNGRACWTEIVNVDRRLRDFRGKTLDSVRSTMLKNNIIRIDTIKTKGRPQKLHVLVDQTNEENSEEMLAGV